MDKKQLNTTHKQPVANATGCFVYYDTLMPLRVSYKQQLLAMA
jgi:hypothetical protein